MDMNNLTNDASASGTPAATVRARKPYEKPSFRCEEVFVTTALQCGKTAALGSQCNLNGLSAS